MVNKKSKKPERRSFADQSTEQKILEAARKEFGEHGLDGARMQSIANRAGVNKALLHYYFRSKEKLFEVILHSIASEIWQTIRLELSHQPKNPDLKTAIRSLVSSYILTFAKNPEIPAILLRLLLTNDKFFPVIVEKIIDAVGDGPKLLFLTFEKEMKAGKITKTDPMQLIMCVMGMIMVTFFGKPIFQILQQKTSMLIAVNTDTFLHERIDFITNLVFDGIKEHKS